jgi:predicted DNA-binding transcriptional regulator AlpA
MKWSNPEGTIILEEVKEILEITNYALYRVLKKKGFPKPINLGKRLVWRKSEIEAWKKENVKVVKVRRSIVKY